MKRTEKVWGVIDLTSGTMRVAKGAFGADRGEALSAHRAIRVVNAWGKRLERRPDADEVKARVEAQWFRDFEAGLIYAVCGTFVFEPRARRASTDVMKTEKLASEWGDHVDA